MVEIDGSYGSGGGQILRTACALAVVTKKPCHVFNIRKNRPRPGLAHQHLLGIQSLAQLCSGNLEGDEFGSKEIKFSPGEVYRDRVFVKIPTAGSITLVLQTLIPPALFAQKPIEIYFEGGATDTFFSPTIDYFRYVFLKILEKMLAPLPHPFNEKERSSGGGRIEIDVLKRGYYPTGGSRVKVKIWPSKLKSIDLIERGTLQKILAISIASDSLKSKKVSERQLFGVREIFKKLKLPVEERVEYTQTESPGSSLCLICQFEDTILGADNLGKLGKPAEEVGRECALKLLEEEKSKACLDRHLADQLLIYLALAGGKSRVSVSQITSHTKTNIWTIQQFLAGEFKIKDNIISFQSVSSSD